MHLLRYSIEFCSQSIRINNKVSKFFVFGVFLKGSHVMHDCLL